MTSPKDTTLYFELDRGDSDDNDNDEAVPHCDSDDNQFASDFVNTNGGHQKLPQDDSHETEEVDDDEEQWSDHPSSQSKSQSKLSPRNLLRQSGWVQANRTVVFCTAVGVGALLAFAVWMFIIFSRNDVDSDLSTFSYPVGPGAPFGSPVEDNADDDGGVGSNSTAPQPTEEKIVPVSPSKPNSVNNVNGSQQGQSGDLFAQYTKHDSNIKYSCLPTSLDVKGAVDLYLLAHNDSSKISDFVELYGSKYGFEISKWCFRPVVTDFSHLFDANRNHLASTFNENISSWNTSFVRDMTGMFTATQLFSQPIGSWQTSRVVSLAGMFENATQFQQDLSSWDTSNVQDMTRTFRGAVAFNSPLNSWKTDNVKTMKGMFQEAKSFNQPLDQWKTDGVTDMSHMFQDAVSFNQSLNSWNVSQAIRLDSMFQGTFGFNQPLDAWQPSSAMTINSMFNQASSFNQSLCRWGEFLRYRKNVSAHSVFRGTDCLLLNSPILEQDIPAPFCAPCGEDGE